ncbi:putative E3 ubiquitin-protein ligase XBAT35 isoform X2 [Wolffia australiana]
MGAEQSKERELYEAVRQLDMDAIRSLRAQGASLNWISPSGKTPLIIACSASRYLPAANLLLQMGADVNFYDPDSRVGTALKRAVERGLEETTILLLSHGANPLLEDIFRLNSLDAARIVGRASLVRAIEDKICLFSGLLLATSNPAKAFFVSSSSLMWAVVLPSDSSLSRRVGSLKIALYTNRQSPRPIWIVHPKRFTLKKADFSGPNAELIFSHQGYGAELKLFSTNPENSTQLRLLYDTNPAMATTNAPPFEMAGTSTSSPLTVNAPSYSWERNDIAKAIAASIRSAIDEGISLSDLTLDEPAREDTSPARWSATAEAGRSGDKSSCVVCADRSPEVVCVPCGHVAGCMECLSEVKRKGFGCPVCRAPIERVLKIYTV